MLSLFININKNYFYSNNIGIVGVEKYILLQFKANAYIGLFPKKRGT